ncbi:RNA polymerase, sigma-24 subunit, ECF subfamily [Acidothermus cellulolyticus 11B]|uniref:RNA polymerase, sigma-24 subunit, ECF subfamily n=2 Tax=Acidothermus cellulolyticus TaxID=28049 RepID=A0LRU3_ACIC1|nr:RNA polymerase, sigma-24 subunit, ECF subfamily [Acidothermus cellulolyticus 11B]
MRQPMPDPSFAALLQAAQAGEEDAFATLWRDVHPALLRYLRVIAGDAAEDLASETWLHVIRGLDRFRGDEAGFRGWVFTVARSKVVDWRRYEGRRPAQPLAHDAELPAAPHPADAADDAIELLETREALRLIGQLPAEQAEIIVLRVIAGLDVDQVARIVGKRPGTVRVACHRGLRRLHDILISRAGSLTGAVPQGESPRPREIPPFGVVGRDAT